MKEGVPKADADAALKNSLIGSGRNWRNQMNTISDGGGLMPQPSAVAT